MHAIRRAVLLSVLALGVAAAQPALAENASGVENAIRIVPRETSARLIYFDPAHAPYLTDDYVSRIDSIVDAVSPSGDISLLTEPASETYARLVRAADVADFALSSTGRKLLQESRDWLIDAKRQQQPGYLKYLQAHTKVVDAAVQGDAASFRDALIALFGEANAYDYVSAMHVGRTYGVPPRNGVLRSIKARTIGEGRRGDTLYYPHPDDLDLVSNWQPVVIRSEDDLRTVRGFVTEIEILDPRIDRVLEEISATSEREPFHVPRRLVFGKELQLIETPDETVNPAARALSLPAKMFEVYASSLTRSPSGIFLLAIEIERVLQ